MSEQDEKIINSFKYLGKYLRINNISYIYVNDIVCDYPDCMCGLIGPNFTISQDNIFIMNWLNDCLAPNIYLNNERYGVCSKDVVEEISQKEFERVLREEIKKTTGNFLDSCKKSMEPIFLNQSENKEVVRLREKYMSTINPNNNEWNL